MSNEATAQELIRTAIEDLQYIAQDLDAGCVTETLHNLDALQQTIQEITIATEDGRIGDLTP